ncbi:tetratricopeptide repeat protein [bacterium]|nr:tetratricopeptide repeat protein [bacterium]
MSDKARLLNVLTVILLPLLLYLPSLGNGYVGWDDGIILNDPSIRSLAPADLARLFLPRAGGTLTWQPMRSLAFALVYAADGLRPEGYLVLNMLLYSLTVFLFYLTVRHLCSLFPEQLEERRAGWVALSAAALFAVHPLHVEAVSWLQGGKFSLLAVFFLGALLSWLRFRANGKLSSLAAAFGLFVCALASQPLAVALPPLILAAEFMLPPPAETAPSASKRLLAAGAFFLPMLAVALQVLFLSTVTHASAAQTPLVARLVMLPSLWAAYLAKFFLPVNICCRYPLSVPLSPPWAGGGLGALAVAVFAWLVLRASGKASRLAGFGLLFAGLTLLPTSGLAPTSTLMADRYLFLPSLGLSLALGLAAMQVFAWVEGKGRGPALAAILSAGIVLLGLGAVSLRRQLDWRGPVSLWSRVLQVYPGHDLAASNLAEAYLKVGNLAAADSLYRRSLKINPANGDAWGNLGAVLRAEGDSAGALEALERAAVLRPDRGAVWVNLANSYAARGQDSLALDAFGRALELKDKWEWQARYNRAKLWLAQGRSGPALEEIESVARTWPGQINAAAWLDLGRTLDGLGRAGLAVELLELGQNESGFDSRCLQLLGNLQLVQGQTEKARASLERALRDDPQSWQSLVLLGSAWQRSGDFAQASSCFERALGAPGADSLRVLNYLALALAAGGQESQALDAWRRCLSADPSFIEGWVNLGLYLRERGHEQAARASLARALALCGDTPALADLRARLNGWLEQKTTTP